jgi:hypothetical protein
MRLIFAEKNKTLREKFADRFYSRYLIETEDDALKAGSKKGNIILTCSNPDFNPGGGLDAQLAKKYKKDWKNAKNLTVSDKLAFATTVDESLKANKKAIIKAIRFAIETAGKMSGCVVMTGLGTGVGGLTDDEFLDLFEKAITGDHLDFGNYTTFGDSNTFGTCTTFGDSNTFGNYTTFGYGTTFGDCCILHQTKRILNWDRAKRYGLVCEKKDATVDDFAKTRECASVTIDDIDCWIFFKSVRPDFTTKGNVRFEVGKWITDDLPFSKEGSCIAGGLYFSDLQFSASFHDDYTTLLEVAVPKGYANSCIDPEGDKCRTDKLFVLRVRD